MKNVITAIGNERLNKELKNEENIKVVCADIQYREGIIEVLEKYKNIDIIIISDNIYGEIEFMELINYIKINYKNINIIIILKNEDEANKKELIKKGIKNIFLKKAELKEILKIINKNNYNNEELKNEIESLKNIILENNKIEKIKKNNNKIINIKKQINNKINLKKNNNKVVSILGAGGVGKSIFIVNLINILKVKRKRILIMDFDILNNSIHTILGKNKYTKIIKKNINNYQKINVNNLIIKINKKTDLISGINLLFDSKYEINNNKIENMINEFKKEYDIILIDTSSECIFEYTQCLVRNSDIAIFLIEANLIGVKKAKRLLEIYIENWKIKKEKIQIIFNKYNLNSINEKILKNIFNEFKIIGKIKFNSNYNLIINKNNKIKNKLINNKIKKEYLKIINKVFLNILL